METSGLWMLAAVAVAMLATGLPAWVVLTGVALAFSAAGIALGAFDLSLRLNRGKEELNERRCPLAADLLEILLRNAHQLEDRARRQREAILMNDLGRPVSLELIDEPMCYRSNSWLHTIHPLCGERPIDEAPAPASGFWGRDNRSPATTTPRISRDVGPTPR